MSNAIDVVYPLGNGSSWMNNELRFSLRSLEKYGEGIRNVYLIGDCPSWIQNVYHVECGDPLTENADGNIALKVLKACSLAELSDKFLFINDDHLLLRPIHIADIPAYNKGTLERFLQYRDTSGIYMRRLVNTLRILTARKLPTLHYDCHTPIVIDKHKFPEVISKFDFKTGVGYGMKSLYGNSMRLPSPYLNDFNIKTIMTEGSIMEAVQGKTHMAYNDHGLNHDLMIFLEKRFFKPSKYEKMDKTISLLQQAENWLENPTSHAEGVQLYVALGKNKHLMSLARADKVGRTQEQIKKNLRAIVDKARSEGRLDPVSAVTTAKKVEPKKDLPVKNKPAGKTVKIDDNPHIRVELLSEDMLQLYNRNKEITREMTPLHEKMKLLPDGKKHDSDRKEYAQKISELENERKSNWETIDKWYMEQMLDGPKSPDPVLTASGKLSKKEIDKIKDPAVKKESELLRIKANKNYIKRFDGSTKPKQMEDVSLRKKELDEWGVKF